MVLVLISMNVLQLFGPTTAMPMLIVQIRMVLFHAPVMLVTMALAKYVMLIRAPVQMAKKHLQVLVMVLNFVIPMDK